MGRMHGRGGAALLFGLGLSAALAACSSNESGGAQTGGASGSGGAPTSSGGGGSVDPNGRIGTFQLALNPAVEQTAPYTSVFGTVYTFPYPTDVIETSIASNDTCTVYKFSRQSCTDPSCGVQTCVATNVCKDKPMLASVGDVTLDGVGPSQLKLTAVNNNYQYPLDLPYPGFNPGSTLTLSATGGAFGPFTIAAKGIAPVELKQASYLVTPGQPLTIDWTAGGVSDAKILITFNLSKHGGSAGYMHCETTDSGSFTIPANLLQALVDLGVAGYPELMFVRKTKGEASVSAGKVAFEVQALAKPALNIYGYCSCFNNADCGSCSDATRTVCDSVRKLCNAP